MHPDPAEILLEPFRLSDELKLANRLVMAPMTRCKAKEGGVPTDEIAAYYARRADAGLIITEGAIVRPDGKGYDDVPGIYNDAQIAGWRTVTDAVHAKGGKIFIQLWHVGRVSHPVFLDDETPVAPSAVAVPGRVARRRKLKYGTPRALETAEIPAVVDAFGRGAANALKAGFDGVEIHGANGYLIDQFLHHQTNLRTDAYGGSPENMARFALEVVDAVTAAAGELRTGIRLSPGAYHYMEGEKRDTAVFEHLLARLSRRALAYVHTGIFDDSMTFDYLPGTAGAFLREHYKGTLVGCGSYTPETGSAAIAVGAFHLLALGRLFISNPNLIEKIGSGEPLVPYDAGMLLTLE